MRIVVDADACPVVDIAVELAGKYKLECLLLCDTAHELDKPGAKTLLCDKGADSVDFVLVNLLQAGDLVITQDYGLAAMCMARCRTVINQNGMYYTDDNIDALLTQRQAAAKYRRAGGRTKGPHKRTEAQNTAFRETLTRLLEKFSGNL